MSPRKTPRRRKNPLHPLAAHRHRQELEKLQHKSAKARLLKWSATRSRSTFTPEARDRGVHLYFQDEKTGEEGRIWLLPGPPPF